ncbi:MAG TPA: hypothetical protein P5186_16245 [Candidatus Paceibacterota bacterium]|nr:hypothetical protein [Verrucomicrobiota bacterium]HRY49600.1 hypothetical protein [Candidatus Paceibacterota bacterium]
MPATTWTPDAVAELPDPVNQGEGATSPFRPSDCNGTPHIVLPGSEVSIMATASNLYQIIAPTHQLFVRGKVIVFLTQNLTRQLVIEPLRPSAARSYFEKFARFFAWRSGKDGKPVLKPTVIPEETARALLDCHIAAELLPPIKGLVNCPLLTEVDGQLIVSSKGYDSRTGMLVLDGSQPEDVSLPEAVKSLEQLLINFEFQTLSDASRAMAAMITPALKMGDLLKGHIPADVAEADQSQSGKTYRQKLIAAIYNETPALVPQKRTGVGGIDESFFEKLVNGRPFIQFDNIRGELDSPALETFLTGTGSFPCRIPHCREIEVDPSRFMVLVTSNGVETTRDLANRASIVRIRKRHQVQFPDTLGEVTKRQSHYLGCVFAVIREWHRQGKPRTQEVRHDFREWCQILDWIVQNVCGMAPLMDGHLDAQQRVSSPILTFLRRIALEIELTEQLGSPLSASSIIELANNADLVVPGLSRDDTLNEEKAKKLLGMKLGTVFKKQNTIELDNFTVTRSEETRSRQEGGCYCLKTYTFDHKSAVTQ